MLQAKKVSPFDKLRHDFNFQIIQDQVLKKAIIKDPLF